MAVFRQPEPLPVAQDPGGASRRVQREVCHGLELRGGTDSSGRNIGACISFPLAAGNDIDRIRAGLRSRPGLVRQKTAPYRDPPVGLDRAVPRVGLYFSVTSISLR